MENALLDTARTVIAAALAEDVGGGDITTNLLIPESARLCVQFTAREALVACGAWLAPLVFEALHPGNVTCTEIAVDGTLIPPGSPLLKAEGSARTLLTGERVALNMMQRLSAVATLTRRYVAAVEGTGAQILDTRKTTPGLRLLEKAAVRAGGGENHRMGLYDAVLIKDNHIAACGSVREAVARARAGTPLPVQVECDTLAQVVDALAAGADLLLLDNMTLTELRQAVTLTAGRIPLEASGGVTLETVRRVAETGVNRISIGALTHSARAVDVGVDVV